MQKNLLLTTCIVLLLLASACSKRHLPESEAKEPVKIVVKKTPVPKVITVNDSVAKKTVDGRLYYDLLGHRYWRNYNDGKYYLFNKNMYDNGAFKPH